MLRVTGIMIVITLFLGLTYYGLVEISLGSPGENSKSHAEVIQVENGYGYQIYYGEKLFIKQEFVPAVHGARPFVSAEDARRVAKLVMEKIGKRISPEITQEEIEALDVVILED